MKRMAALMLCLILCISLVGCGKPLVYRIDLKHAEDLALYCWDGIDSRGVNKVPVDLTETMREELENIFHGMLMTTADDVPAGATVASIRTESFVIGVFREGQAFLQSGNLCCNFWLKGRKLDRFMNLISPYIQPKMDSEEEITELSEEPKEESTVEYVGVSIPGWLPLDGWIAEYELCVPEENLADRKGEQLDSTLVRYAEDGNSLKELTVFRENSHTDLNRVIAESEDGQLSLWTFQRLCVDDGWEPECFPDHMYPERYTGRDVLSVIYGAESAADIVSVTVSPSTRDYTPAGDEMRERIGTLELTDPEEIQALYDILTEIQSAAQEETQNLPQQEIAVRSSFPGMGYEYCLMRELRIEFANGAVMELLEYDAAYGRFWTPGTNGYLPVSAEDAKTLEQLLGINLELFADDEGVVIDGPVAEPNVPVGNLSVEEQPASPEDGSISVDRENWGPPETEQPDPEVTEEDGQTLAALLASLPYTDEVCEGLHDYTVIAGGNTYYICLNCCAVVLGDRQANLTEAQLAEILSCLN